MFIPSAVFTTIVIPSAVFATIVSVAIVPVVFEPFMVKPSAAEVGSIIPFEIRAIVFIVDTVAVVATIGGVVIVNIPGEFVLIYDGGRSRRISISILAISVLVVLILINRSRGRGGVLLIYYSGRGRCAYIYPDTRHPESNMGVDIYLGIGRAGDEGGSKDRSKNKQAFHFRRF